jgi:YVTN family beta-propeller protein
MNLTRCFIFTLIVAILCLAGCENQDDGLTPAPPATSKAVYILNGLGQTLSVIDVNTGIVTNNVASAGLYPNHVLYHNGKLFVVNSGSNNVQVFHADSYVLLGTITLALNSSPMTIAVLNDQKAYVACSTSDSVVVVNPATYAVVKSIAAGVGTTGIATANGKVYASNTAFDGTTYAYGQGTVTVINTSTDAVITTLDVGKNPQAIAVAPDGKLHVLCSGDYAATVGSIAVIDPGTDTIVKNFTIGGSPGNITIAANNMAYCGLFGAGLITYDASTYAIRDSSANPLLKKGGAGTVVDLAGNIYVADFSGDQVIMLDNTLAQKRVYDVGDGPLSLSVK